MANENIPVLSDLDLTMRFESLGDSCELGLVQRAVGAEPLGLFRFAGAPVRHVIRAMRAGFANMAEPNAVHVQPENGEYMIKLTKYDFIYHAHVNVGDAEPEPLHRQHVRTVGFLVDKLIGDLEQPDKIFVFRQNEAVSANDLLDLRAAIANFGPGVLLWVQVARDGHPAGSVDVIDDRLMIGYVSRLAPRNDAHHFDMSSWLTMLRQAYAKWPRNGATEAPPPIRLDLVFGRGGNAGAAVGIGWSAQEDGFSWSVNNVSELTLANPGINGDAWLAMEVVPFIAPPSLPAQTLRVSVNGEPVHVFDPVARGLNGCMIPGRLLAGQPIIRLTLEHPLAAAPCAVTGQKDDRRLAVSFHRLSLVGI